MTPAQAMHDAPWPTVLRRVDGQYARGLQVEALRGRASERWTQDERDTLNALTNDTPEAIVGRAMEGSYVGRLMAAMTFLAQRGLIYVEGGSIRLTNTAFQAAERTEAP